MQLGSKDVANTVRAWIADGTYRPGEQLPTAQQLAEDLSCSRDTALRGYRLLQEEGLVLASTSRGTWVREHLVFETDASTFEAADRPEAGGDAFTEAVLAAGRTPSTTFAMRIAPCPKHIAERLGTEPDSLVCVRSVIQKVDGVPWSQQVSYYSMDIAEQCGLTVPHNIKEGTVRRMASFGHVEVACIDEHTSRPPTPAEQARLGMPVGTPMKVWTRTAATTTRVTRVTVTFLPSDRNLIVHKQGISAGLRVIQATRAAWTQA